MTISGDTLSLATAVQQRQRQTEGPIDDKRDDRSRVVEEKATYS